MNGGESPARLWLTTILPFGLGFFLTAIFRVINAVLAGPLETSLNLNPSELGLLTSTYALTFALTQIPLGLLLDAWGARRTQSLFFLVGAAGIILFGLSSSVTMLSIARAILGIGMAGGLMAAFKAVADRVEPKQIPFFNSVILGAGGIGGLIATSPAKAFEVHFGWRPLCFMLGAVTVFAAVLVFMVFRDPERGEEKESGFVARIRGLKVVLRDRTFWKITPVMTVAYGGFMAMQGLWLGPWFQRIMNLTPTEGAEYLSMVAIATAVGFLSGGAIKELAVRLGVRLGSLVAIGIALHIVTQVFVILNLGTEHLITWFIYGFFGQIPIIYFAGLTQHFGHRLSGRALTAANILVFLFMFAFQYLFGVLVHNWPRAGGVTETEAYQFGLAGLVALETLALVWYVVFKGSARTADEA